MGNNCTPGEAKSKKDIILTENEKKQAEKEAEPNEKLTEILEKYKQENEGMKKELEEVKRKGEKDVMLQRQATEENQKILKELHATKTMLAEKEQALIRHQLEAALHSKANSMLDLGFVAKLLKKGTLSKYTRNRKVKSVKEKWVELELHNCQNTEDGFERGYMLLTYSDSKDSKLSNRCQVVSVDGEAADIGDKYKGRNFLVRVLVGGNAKELVFVCIDEKVRNDWVEAFKDGFIQIEEEDKDMHEPYFLEVKFTKEKLGIYVVEVFLDSKEHDWEEKQMITDDIKESKTKPNDALEEEAKQVETKEDVGPEAMNEGTQSEEEIPCELFVKRITDTDLYKSGLVPRCIVLAINGIQMRGLSYDKQVGYLNSTKKPYTLTFCGPKYLFKKTVAPCTAMLKELVTDGDNKVKVAFNDLLKGTEFSKALEKCDDKVTMIGDLLSSHRKLTQLLEKVGVQEQL